MIFVMFLARSLQYARSDGPDLLFIRVKLHLLGSLLFGIYMRVSSHTLGSEAYA
jgi:hypothetical protein